MDDRLNAAFEAVPRHLFLRESEKKYADLDRPLPIGFGVTNSQPTTVRNMLSLLGVQRGDRVLDVGSGSGWTTALLAELAGPEGLVIGVERIPELVERSRATLESWPNAEIVQATPGVYGVPQRGPYNRILVSAMADEVPQDLLDQLARGGVLVLPVSGVMKHVEKTPDGRVQTTDQGWYSFVPLLP